ncbi:MAG: hypothetical protein MZW92_50560 [Comamonadaceae bacterium]|nr:hypothetical protein [Comamonadaceae bacterium]
MADATIESALPDRRRAARASSRPRCEKRFGRKLECARCAVDPALIGGVAWSRSGDAGARRLRCKAQLERLDGRADRLNRTHAASPHARRRDARNTMQLNPSEISELIKSRIQSLGGRGRHRARRAPWCRSPTASCRVHGLSDVMQGEMLEFPQATPSASR